MLSSPPLVIHVALRTPEPPPIFASPRVGVPASFLRVWALLRAPFVADGRALSVHSTTRLRASLGLAPIYDVEGLDLFPFFFFGFCVTFFSVVGRSALRSSLFLPWRPFALLRLLSSALAGAPF